MNRDHEAIAGTVSLILIVTVIGVLVFNFSLSRTRPVGSATVIAKSYTPSQTSIGSGISSSGKAVTTVNTTSEKYVVIVDHFGTARSIEVEADTWVKASDGQRVELEAVDGPLFNMGYRVKLNP